MTDEPNMVELSMYLDPEIDQDHPQTVYTRRASEGIVFSEDDFFGPCAKISAMADVLVVNRHRGVLAHRPGTPPTMGGVRPLIPLDIDGDDHTRYRRLLDPLFAPKRMAMLEDRVRDLANELVDRFIDKGHVELYGDFCQPLPSTIFITMLGLPLSEMQYFLRFKDWAIRAPGDTIEEQAANRDRAGRDMANRLYEELERRRSDGQPGDDLIAGFMETGAEGDRLSDDDIVDICFLLVIAGLDTVAASLSCIVLWLARNPEAQQHLRGQPETLPRVIEELMRFESPVPGGARYAAEDIEVNGTVVPSGTSLQMSWACANVDEAAFPNPLEVNFERAENRHIAFASGFHRCLGSHLARLELRTAIEVLHARTSRYWVADGSTPRVHNLGVRTVEHLPLAFDVPLA
jgi:cytochrome P450